MNPATLDFARIHREDDVRELALRRAPEGVDMTAALQQIVGWQIARRKLPAWAACDDILYPVRLSMEQCSSQITGEYKRRICPKLRIKNEELRVNAQQLILNSQFSILNSSRFTDLTGGLGVDFSFLAPLFDEATYVERDAELCELARHNMAALLNSKTQKLKNSKTQILNSDAESVLDTLPHQSLIFIDPARRDAAGRKVFMTADCQPDVARLHDRLVEKADVVMIKLSPMLDIHDALRSLPATRQVHVVEVHGEVKELLLLLSKEPIPSAEGVEGEPLIVCTDTERDFSFIYKEESEAEVKMADSIGAYLYEPAPSIMKAGAFRTVGVRYGVKKLHRDTHLYTSDVLIADFPGRILHVDSVGTMREAKALLSGVSHANIVTRNFPMRPDDLRRRLRIKDGGSHYLYATTVANNHLLLLCHP